MRKRQRFFKYFCGKSPAMEKSYFRINKKEYCHINDEFIFIVNTKEPTRIPTAHELGEGWGIKSTLNYIIFFLLFLFTAMSITAYGTAFFIHPVNYGALLLLFYFLAKIRLGFVSSRTPTIDRKLIHSVEVKTPWYSFPRVVVEFDGPEGKVLKRVIRILYPKEAIPVLKAHGLIS